MVIASRPAVVGFPTLKGTLGSSFPGPVWVVVPALIGRSGWLAEDSWLVSDDMALE